MNLYPRIIVAGTHSGVGKTTVTLALLAALKRRGRRVQAFKAGPDFIDPSHHTAITGRPSRNLDSWMLGAACNRGIFTRAAADAELSIIEGMMGLFDGSSAINETGSTAELAKQLQAPVLFNRVGNEGHYRLLKDAVETVTDVSVVGYLQPDPSVTIQDRHLGLIMAVEQKSAELYDQLAKAAMDTI